MALAAVSARALALRAATALSLCAPFLYFTFAIGQPNGEILATLSRYAHDNRALLTFLPPIAIAAVGWWHLRRGDKPRLTNAMGDA